MGFRFSGVFLDLGFDEVCILAMFCFFFIFIWFDFGLVELDFLICCGSNDFTSE